METAKEILNKHVYIKSLNDAMTQAIVKAMNEYADQFIKSAKEYTIIKIQEKCIVCGATNKYLCKCNENS